VTVKLSPNAPRSRADRQGKATPRQKDRRRLKWDNLVAALFQTPANIASPVWQLLRFYNQMLDDFRKIIDSFPSDGGRVEKSGETTRLPVRFVAAVEHE
jgi:hypothetical protein